MALVDITNVQVLDNPTSFTNPFQFEVTFECIQELSDDLEWKVIYVGCAEDSMQDQTLEEVMVGPVEVGHNKFVLQAPAPLPENIAASDLIGVTVVLVTCSFLDHEFVRIGYYVNNEYSEPYEEGTIPNPIDITKLRRNILAAEPRVTRFAIDWTGGNAPPVAAGQEGGEAEDVDVDMDDEGMHLDDMEGDSEDDGSDEDDEDGDVDLDAADDQQQQGGEADDAVALGSPDGGMQMVQQEDSNSMDVGMMQQAAASLY